MYPANSDLIYSYFKSSLPLLTEPDADEAWAIIMDVVAAHFEGEMGISWFVYKSCEDTNNYFDVSP